tara:strand:- start:127 stop:573 length:447 start_codon:yes stop_codon:yes gene_type:complete
MAKEDRAGFSSKTNTIKLIMKLELKHLAPYLPYELKIYESSYFNNGIKTLGLGQASRSEVSIIGVLHLQKGRSKVNKDYYNDRYKPILKPLSDLTEEYSNSCNYSHKDFKWEIINKNISVLVWDSLLKNHFDVFGLIDAGLAIDINTL